jgi:hypothetical protein
MDNPVQFPPADSLPPSTLRLGTATPLAVGQVRAVYQHPHNHNELIKIVRAEIVASRWGGRGRWLKRLPRVLHYVGYLRELKEYIAARARAPGIDPPIARMIGVIDTDLGLGLVTEKVVDADGALAPTLAAMYEKSRGFTPAIDAALAAFLDGLLACNVIVGDMHAWNIVYGSDSRGGPRFVMIDGFGEKHFIPLASMSRGVNVRNTHRLYRRMRAQLQVEVPLAPV